MRIPLDYYRILGLPIQATAEQLRQAHRDRTLQLPRREFSETAIAARRELIDEAFAVLSDPTQRQTYDANFLAKSYDLPDDGADLENGLDNGIVYSTSTPPEPADHYTSSIEIQDHQWVGALLILLEMGEYELVIKLGRPYLGSNSPETGTPEIIAADITLTIALACLELGREQWQQGRYENAAEALATGKDVLLQAGLFANIRGEMYSDLSKLRPYRILELVALPEDHKAERENGLLLLSDMLEEREGMDGAGDDQSGLSMDDFLRFIQQLRSYLTSAEQHALFEKESRRPSAVATYLAVYALLARGFAQRQPGLVRRAKQMLTRLGSRQDVHLEQAVCALLLGQTEEASLALDLSQEFESIAFIREHSQGAPDLLPGLCLYSERWLQNEVFPHFLDLAQKQASLKEYFADEDVQAYLEELPSEPQPTIMPGSTSMTGAAHSTGTAYRPSARSDVTTLPEPRLKTVEQDREHAGHPSNGANTALVEPPQLTNNTVAIAPSSSTSEPLTRQDSDSLSRSNGRGNDDSSSRRTTPVPPVDRARRSNLNSPRLDRLLFLAALSMIGILLVAFLTNWLMKGRSTQPAAAAPGSAAPAVIPQLKKLQPILTGKVSQPTAIASGTLTTESALAVVKNWLMVKAAAMGETHAADQLPKALVGSALSQWQTWADSEKAGNSYLKYEHSDVAVDSVSLSPDSPDQAIVEAKVVEKREAYVDGKLEPTTSSPANLQIRYTLVRQNGQWLIQAIEPI